MTANPIRVKFLTTETESAWLHQLPDNNPLFNGCLFIFDKNEPDYDWLVVYDDMPRPIGTRITLSSEQLRCQPDNSILVTQEPSSVKYYGKKYTDQFGHVLTSQPEYALPHRSRHHSQPALFWFYGVGKDRVRPYADLVKNEFSKTNDLSVVWSNKKQVHTLHHQRLKFLKILRENIHDMDIFGKGEIPLPDKADALDNYKYHIAIENHFGEHHWTEKLADSFLGLSLPFYYGCPNLADYFPEQSFIRIDIFQPEKSLEIIQKAINNNEYEKRLEHLIEAKQRLINEHNLFVVLSKLIKKHNKAKTQEFNGHIYSRRIANRKTFVSSMQYLLGKLSLRIRYITKKFFHSPKIDL